MTKKVGVLKCQDVLARNQDRYTAKQVRMIRNLYSNFKLIGTDKVGLPFRKSLIEVLE